MNLFWYVLVLRQISICFNSLQPLIAGHEIVGHVVKIGSKVTGFKVGDRAGVGYALIRCVRY